MPIEIGLLSTQQDSFQHHEELSKLLHETDVRKSLFLLLRHIFLKVFYVPLRNEFGENVSNTNQDLTKRFDEDLSNKHLIVVCIKISIMCFFIQFE